MSLVPSKWTVFAKRLAERVAWTAIEAGAAYALTEAVSLPAQYVVPVSAVLAWIKGMAAKHVGDKDDPAITPLK